jgi:hypothetical protein
MRFIEQAKIDTQLRLPPPLSSSSVRIEEKKMETKEQNWGHAIFMEADN